MSDFLARLREPEVPHWLRLLYSLVFLTTFVHGILTREAWMCCPPAYGEFSTFAHCVQVAAGWTGATIAFAEVITSMVLLVPKVYYGIKEKGERDGIVKGRAEGIAEGKAEGIAEGMERGKSAGKAEGVAEGMERGKSEGRAEGRAEGKAEGVAEGKYQGVDAALDAMREAGFDEDARRRVEDIIARRAFRNGGL